MLLIQFQLVPNPGVRPGTKFGLNCPSCRRSWPFVGGPSSGPSGLGQRSPTPSAKRGIPIIEKSSASKEMPCLLAPFRLLSQKPRPPQRVYFPKHESGSCADRFAPAPPLNNYRQDAEKIS